MVLLSIYGVGVGACGGWGTKKMHVGCKASIVEALKPTIFQEYCEH